MFLHLCAEPSFSTELLCVSLGLHWHGFTQETNLLISSLQHWASSQVNDTLKAKRALGYICLTTSSSDHPGPSMTHIKALQFFAEGFQDTICQQEASHRNGWCRGWIHSMVLLSLITRSRREESSWFLDLKARLCSKYLFISKMRCDSKINKVPQIKALKLLFEGIFNDKPVPDKGVSLWSQNPFLDVLLSDWIILKRGSNLRAFTVYF